MATPIKIIATHLNPHLDEIAGIWLLKKFAGIIAEIQYWDSDKIKKSPEEYEAEGILLLGIGGGKFDEHPSAQNGRKEGECCATLVAKHLGVEEDLALEKILQFVVNNDLKAASHPFDLAYIVKLLHQQFPENPEKVLEWAFVGLEAKYQEQLQFFTTTKDEFFKKAFIETVVVRERTLNVVTIESDDPFLSKFARSSYGCNAAVVIQQRSSGNVQIFPNKKFRIDLHDIAQIIRAEEQKCKGKIITTDWKVLASEGTVDGAEEWFFHEEGQLLLNGSITAPNVPPTRIPLERIQELAKIGIAKGMFQLHCNPQTCWECPWYKWGLHRCRKLRFERFHK